MPHKHTLQNLEIHLHIKKNALLKCVSKKASLNDRKMGLVHACMCVEFDTIDTYHGTHGWNSCEVSAIFRNHNKSFGLCGCVHVCVLFVLFGKWA